MHPSRHPYSVHAFAVAVSLLLFGRTSLAQTNLVMNGSFDTDSSGWWQTDNLTGAVVDGGWCLEVPAGTTNPWDAIVGQGGLPLSAGAAYRFSFTA